MSILGAGYMGRVHAESWTKLDCAEVIKVYSRNLSRAKSLAREIAAQPVNDIKEAILSGEVDVVDICLPTFLHKEVAVKALKAEKHLLLEKPIALTLNEAKEIINAAEKTSSKFMVAHCLRFFPEYAKIKQLLDSHSIGDVRVMRAYRIGTYPTWGSDNWFSNLSKSGGVLIDLMIHDFDFMRWLIGDEVERVYAQVNEKVAGHLRKGYHAMAILKFKGGAIAYAEGSWALPATHPFTMYFEVAGTKGLLTYSNRKGLTCKAYYEKEVQELSPTSKSGYDLEIEHFAKCILMDLEPMIKPIDAYNALEIAIAAKKSAETNRPVQLPLRGD